MFNAMNKLTCTCKLSSPNKETIPICYVSRTVV